MLEIIYTVGQEQILIVRQGASSPWLLLPMADFLSLREMVRQAVGAGIDPAGLDAPDDPDVAPSFRAGAWWLGASSIGIALRHVNGTLYIHSDEWTDLLAVLFIDDVLITMSEAAELTGRSLSDLSQRADRGQLMVYPDLAEPNPSRRNRVRKSQVLALPAKRKNGRTTTTKSEREPVLARALELVKLGPGSAVIDRKYVIKALCDEFGITLERARQMVAKAARMRRGGVTP